MYSISSVLGENDAKNIKRICRDKFKYIVYPVSHYILF